MDRAIPVSNKLLQQVQKERTDELLFKKLKHIQNSRSEYSYRIEAKKAQAETHKRKNNFLVEMRHKEVSRENAILAKKIKETEKRSLAAGRQSLSAGQPRQPAKADLGGAKQTTGSLGTMKEPRRRELEKISADNMYLMSRIESMKSVYGVDTFVKHNLKRREVLELRCEYPVVIESDLDKALVRWAKAGRHQRSFPQPQQAQHGGHPVQ